MIKPKLKDLSLDMSEEEYRALDIISYSFLSTMDKMGPRVINYKFDGNAATNFGCLVEDLLLEPDMVKNKYYIQNEILSEGKLKEAIDLMKEYILDYDGDIFDESVIQSYIDKEGLDVYYEKKNSEWRANKIYKEGYIYIKSLFKSKGKIIIDSETYFHANKCADTLRNHVFSKWIFEEKAEIEVFNQFKGKSEINGVPFKFMIDRVFINHVTKTIELIDIKTGAKDFESSFKYWRYDIQQYLYQFGFEKEIMKNYPDYKLLPFKFLYICKETPSQCLLYTLALEDNVKVKKDITRLINDYIWYKDNSFQVDFPEKVYKDNGIITIQME